MRSFRPEALALGAILAAAAGLLGSCATAPARSPAEWMGVLPSDSTLYVSLRVQSSAALVKRMLREAGPDAAEVAPLVDRTQRVVLAVTLVPGGKPGFAAAALGSYPSGIIGCRLSGNRDWKQAKSAAGRFWRSSRTGLEVAVPGRTVLLAASGGMEGLLSRSAAPGLLRVPEEVALDMQRADLVLYLPELPGGLAPGSASASVPIREVWLDAEKREGRYEVTGTANTGSEREAKLVALVTRLALVAWMRGQEVPNAVERLKPVTIEPDGPQVKMAGLAFSEEEIGPLFLSLVAPRPRAGDPGSGQGTGQAE